MKRSVVANTVPTSYQDLVKHFQMKGQATRKIQSPMERHNVSATSRQQHNASRMEIH